MSNSVRARYYKAIFMLVTLLVFTDEMFYGTIVPLIPVYTKMLHLTSLTMGEIFAAYAIGLLLFSIPMGLIAQRCGYKRVFICGMASLALSCVLFGFINSPLMLFFGRLVQGISGAATWNAGFAVCARMYPKHQGQKIGVLMAVVGVGTISGPPIGGMLYELFGFHLMFIVLACFCLIQVFLLSFVHFGSLDNHPRNSARVSLRAVVGNQRLMWFCLIFIICTCSFGMLEVIIPNYMSVKFAANSFIIGLLFGIMGLCNAGSDYLFGMLSDRYGFMPFIFWGIIASALIVPCLH